MQMKFFKVRRKGSNAPQINRREFAAGSRQVKYFMQTVAVTICTRRPPISRQTTFALIVRQIFRIPHCALTLYLSASLPRSFATVLSILITSESTAAPRSMQSPLKAILHDRKSFSLIKLSQRLITWINCWLTVDPNPDTLGASFLGSAPDSSFT